MKSNKQTLDKYFIKDGALAGIWRKKSVILSLERDMAFCIGLPAVWDENSARSKVPLDKDSYKKLLEIRPTFTVVSQFCTGVDVLARVLNKRKPGFGENGAFFKQSAEELFQVSSDCLNDLWDLRNGISHNYRLVAGLTRDIGSKSPVEKRDGKLVFYLHAMYSTLGKAKRELYEKLSKEPETEVKKTEQYLNKNGFFFTRDS